MTLSGRAERPRRAGSLATAVLVVAALVLAGCDSTSSTTGPSVDTTAAGSTTTVPPGDDAIVVMPGRDTCAYRAHELIAVQGRASELASRLGTTVAPLVPGGDLSTDAYPLGLSLYRIGSGVDPIRASISLAGSAPELRAAPNYVLAFTPGWQYAPFDTPVGPVADHELPTAVSQNEVTIAVLDTGFVPVNEPGLRPPVPAVEVEAAGSVEVVEGAAAGHGTFIVGLLGQLAPNATITPIPIRPRFPSDDALAREGEELASSIRDDATVTAALIAALAEPADYLNMSLGTYGCSSIDTQPREQILDVPDHLTPIALRRALEILASKTGPHGQTPQVFAAAGNDAHLPTDREVFFPAAWAPEFDWLHSVASDPKDGVDYSNRGTWVETQARGTRAVSLVPDGTVWGEAGWYLWSGTSFATPCALAHHTTGPEGTYDDLASNPNGPFLECGLNREADPPAT